MKEVCEHDIKMLKSRVSALEEDIDSMMNRFDMVSRLWDAVKELQDLKNRDGEFLTQPLLYREAK